MLTAHRFALIISYAYRDASTHALPMMQIKVSFNLCEYASTKKCTMLDIDTCQFQCLRKSNAINHPYPRTVWYLNCDRMGRNSRN